MPTVDAPQRRAQGRRALLPSGRVVSEVVAVQRDDAEQVTAGSSERVAALPTGHLDRAQSGQPLHLRCDVVCLDVDVVGRGVTNRLHRNNDVRGAVMQRVELRLSWGLIAGAPNAADQNAALAAAWSSGASISTVERRLRCICPRLPCCDEIVSE